MQPSVHRSSRRACSRRGPRPVLARQRLGRGLAGSGGAGRRPVRRLRPRCATGATGPRPGRPAGRGRRPPRQRTGPDPGTRPQRPAVGEPGREAGRLPVGRQVDRSAGLDIDQDGPVVPSVAGRVLVDTDDPRGRRIRLGPCADQAYDRASADTGAKHPGHASAGQSQPDVGERRAEPFRALAVAARQPCHLLDIRPPLSGGVPAGEASHSQPENHASAATRYISRKPQVGAVDPIRPRPAHRT